MPETFLADHSDGVLTVTLNRPQRLNATNRAAAAEMAAFWTEVARDPAVRCIVLTGRAGAAFSAGADAEDMASGIRPRGDIGYIAAIDFCPGEYVKVPILAAVNGLCVGAGLNFVADADLVVASSEAWFSDPHVAVGQVSAMEPLMLAPKLPYGVIAKLVLLANSYRMSAAEALEAGLVHEVVAPEQLLARAHEMATIIASQSPTAVRESLGVLRRYARSLLADQLDEGWAIVFGHFAHPDATEGPQAFLDKRPPIWVDPADD